MKFRLEHDQNCPADQVKDASCVSTKSQLKRIDVNVDLVDSV